jgi:hypothetical protein
MDKILKEEIDRFKLLSNYDNKKTLDENYKSNEVITENWFSNLFKLGSREAGALSKTAIKEVEELFRLIPTEMKKFGVDAAEVTAKLQAKSFTAKELGEFRKTVFKNITDVKTRKELADDMVKSKAFQDLFTSTKEKKVIDELIKKGYSGDDAKVLIDRYKRTGGKFLDDVKGTIKPKPTKTKAPKITPQSLGSTSARKSYAQIAWEILQAPFKVGGFIIGNFWKIFWLALSVGVAYYLWNNLNQKIKKYPKCLYRGQSPDDFKKMYEEKLEYIIITETGNEFIDDNGGGRFYIDNTFETDNRKYKGKWSDEGDLDVLVTLSNGEEHSLPCDDISDFEDERDIVPKEKTQTQIEKERILSSWDGKYEKCDDFPMTIGCINDGVIGTVQICLGLPKDGKFSPKVLDALEKEGYGFEISFDIYKTIQSKCGMSSSESGFASNL